METESYYEQLDGKIKTILSRSLRETLTYDILDDEESIKNKQIALKEKQRQMKVGEIMQVAVGNWPGFEDLGVGHVTGLDVLSVERKVIVELKNRTNTDNASSKKENLNKLARFKKANPEYTCIYANINDNTEEKTLKGMKKIIMHDGVEIEHMVGMEFLKFVFGEHVNEVIEFLKYSIRKHS